MPQSSHSEPWYRRVHRWGQTNITEADPPRYDLEFWRQHWQQTRAQGVIVNAGGIVAYYPSRFPLQYRAAHLGDRDTFGAVSAAAREMGLAVLARMDSNRAGEDFYRQHPDWFAVDGEGRPYRAQERYIACVNSPYYRQYLPQILIEVIERYRPDGFTDNSWSGLGRGSICCCPHCRAKFQQASGRELPGRADWDSPVYRQWVRWNYACRLEIWDLNNAVTRQHGGEDCLWLGMVHANPVGQSRGFRDLREIGRRSKIVMCDHQSRDPNHGMEQNSFNGKLLHGVAGWQTVVPESMAMYVRGPQAFRICANPAEESRLWMIEGMAGGISPWWHHIGACHEDRRQYDTAPALMRWHETVEPYLYNRQPVAAVGVLWSHENIDFYGRDNSDEHIDLPMRGWAAALTRARIPFLPIHADALDSLPPEARVLILPDLGVMSDAQVQGVRQFVERGGGLIATGCSSLYDGEGERRSGLALGDLLGAQLAGIAPESDAGPAHDWETCSGHTYLRLTPELNQPGALPDPGSQRHPVLQGLDRTDIIPFGGRLEHVTADDPASVLATFVPAFPVYPPEFCWMRAPRTNLPAVLVRQLPAGARLAYLPGDLDRCYGRAHLPDHGDLLANLVRWAAHDRIPLRITGPGHLDCHFYRQGSRYILHVVNLTGVRPWPGYVEDHIPVGPVQVEIALPDATPVPQTARLHVSNQSQPVLHGAGCARFTIPGLLAHELAVIE